MDERERKLRLIEIERARAKSGAGVQLPERQGWIKNWLGTQQGVFDEPQSVGDIALDVAAATGAGLARGAKGIAETPEVALRASQRGKEEVFGLLGAPIEDKTPVFDTYTGAAIEGVTDALGLSKAMQYRSEGGLGSLSGVGGEVMSAAATGPAGLFKKAAKLYGTGVGMEAAGQIMDPTGYGDVARIATGLAAPSAISATRRPVRDIDEQALKDAQFLKDRGVEFEYADVTGQNAGRSVERSSQKFKDFTTSVLATLGNVPKGSIKSYVDEVPLAVDTARKKFLNDMSEATFGINIGFNRLEQSKISSAMERFNKSKGLDAEDAVPQATLKKLRNRFLNTKESISRDQYVSYRQDLSRLTTNPNQSISTAANNLLSVLDDAVDRTLSGTAGREKYIGTLASSRSKLRDIYALEAALKKTDDGIIMPKDLRDALSRQNSRQLSLGERGEIGELAKAGNRLLSPGKKQSSGFTAADVKTTAGTLAGVSALASLIPVDYRTQLALITAATTLSPVAVRKAMQTEMGQNYLINRALRSDQGKQLGEDRVRTLIGTMAAGISSENEDQQ
jgi:hypothetical protein